jgi:uncharacterized repeat protein (TIGR03847 family)
MEAKMANMIELNPVDFVTIGTIGPKGQRVFHLQAGQDKRLISFTIEKEQAWALSEAIKELLDDIDERDNTTTVVDFSNLDMDLREPIEPMFRIAQMGLAYEADDNMVILIAQEFSPPNDDDDDVFDDDDDLSFLNDDGIEPNIVRMWCTREQIHALSLHAIDTVKSGRPDAKQNGRIIYYWT